MTKQTPPLAITMGDPAGCGPQITAQTWMLRAQKSIRPFFVIGDPRLYQPYVPVAEIDTPAQATTAFESALPVLPVELACFDTLKAGQADKVAATAIIASIEKATQACLNGAASAMVTNPISKSVLYEAGFTFPGHTEFIASLCTQPGETPLRPVMMLVGGGLRVALVTIHVPLMKVPEHMTPETIAETATITWDALRTRFGISSPRLAFTGLNPHAGEDASIGTEERDIINPVADSLRRSGIDITDARPADTVFHEALAGRFDAVIAMTHDQGLIPVKTLDLWGGVNCTLGLPVIRTSPDHGTAYEAAAAGTCRPDSLLAAIELASTFVSHCGDGRV